MTLEQIQEMWKVDSVIDQIDLDKASLQTPSLHAKYLELLNEKRLSLKSYEVKYNQLLKTKWMWYTDCLLYTSPSPRDYAASRMPSSA